jgi:hypothetical protein
LIAIFSENSYASHSDADVGQSVIDRYSKIIKDFVDDAVSLTSDYSSKSSDEFETLDNATVAVMERLNLHDILVRIPMNHGELGPNSNVGHADHLCSRKMNQVPMSDFFAAPSSARHSLGQMKKRGLLPSLWMSERPLDADSKDLRQVKDDTGKECLVGGGPIGHPGMREMKEQRMAMHPKGISPSDPKFLLMAAGFFVCTTFASRIW